MSVKIFFFIKVFKEKSYLDDFLNGILYMNPLSFFKSYEEEYINNISDKYEGIGGWYQPKNIILKIGDHVIPSDDIVSPIAIQHTALDTLNIYSLYSGDNKGFDEITSENVSEFEEHLKLDKTAYSLGDYCAVVMNPSLFQERIINAAKVQNLNLVMDFIEYYSPDDFHGNFSFPDGIFKKQIQYSHQNEYRIVINRNSSESNAFRFNIGSISDICYVCETKDFNDKLKVVSD